MSSTNGSVRRNNVTSAGGSALQIKNRNTREFRFHQLTIERVAAASGVISLKVLPKGSGVAEPLTDENEVVMTVDAAAPETVSFEGLIECLLLDVSGLTGTVNVVLESV